MLIGSIDRISEDYNDDIEFIGGIYNTILGEKVEFGASLWGPDYGD